jgi:aminocarboxymuconate-semialdehyde decarboxylase
MGPDHVLFGSDFPYEIGDADGSIALPVVSALDADQRDAILFGNAKRLLG